MADPDLIPRAVSFGKVGSSASAARQVAEAPAVFPEAPVLEPLIVLGFRQANLVVNEGNGKNKTTREFTFEIPEGTTHVVASLSGFQLLFGQISIVDGNEEAEILDHHLGFEGIRLRITEVGSVTATLQTDILLRDYNGDDRWAGLVDTLLIFFGPHPSSGIG
jgi:hypothetical protein